MCVLYVCVCVCMCVCVLGRAPLLDQASLQERLIGDDMDMDTTTDTANCPNEASTQ